MYYLVYFIVGWLKTSYFIKADKLSNYPSVSILIPVRNEEEHIANLLFDIQKQDYPKDKIEIIIIDDESTDKTVEIVKSLNFENVKLLHLHFEKEIFAYKKKAITLGVENSKSELIVTTDGDCRMGPEWISTIVDYYNRNDVVLISAPVTYENEKHWFEKVQTVEFQFLIAAAAACIKNGMPNTCNGANMAYTKKLFEEINGYEGIDEIANGDDEMLLHKVYQQYPKGIGFVKSTKAVVRTFAKSELKSFIQQRKRWAAKSSKYFDIRAILMVSVIFLFNLSIFLSIPLAFYFKDFATYLWQAILLKTIFDGSFIYLTLLFFKKKKLTPYIILVELFYTFYMVYIGIVGNTGSTYVWKDRNVK